VGLVFALVVLLVDHCLEVWDLADLRLVFCTLLTVRLRLYCEVRGLYYFQGLVAHQGEALVRDRPVRFVLD